MVESIEEDVSPTASGFQEQTVHLPLFDGAITCDVPLRFKDVSNIREVPDNQEVLSDYDTEESIIIELLELKDDVRDEDSARWFFHNVASEQEAEDSVEFVRALTEQDAPHMASATQSMSAAGGRMTVIKGRQALSVFSPAGSISGHTPAGRDIVKVFLANLRLRGVGTDLVITVNQKVDERGLNQLSSGRFQPLEVLQLLLRTLKVEDWGLFVN